MVIRRVKFFDVRDVFLSFLERCIVIFFIFLGDGSFFFLLNFLWFSIVFVIIVIFFFYLIFMRFVSVLYFLVFLEFLLSLVFIIRVYLVFTSRYKLYFNLMVLFGESRLLLLLVFGNEYFRVVSIKLSKFCGFRKF